MASRAKSSRFCSRARTLQISLCKALVDGHHNFGYGIGVARDARHRARLQRAQEQRVAAADNLEGALLEAHETGQRLEVAGAVLDANYIGATRHNRFGHGARDGVVGVLRNVIEVEGHLGHGVGHAAVVLDERVIGQRKVVGGDDRNGVGARCCGVLRQLDCLARGGRAHVRNHRHALVGGCHSDLEDAFALVRCEQRRFACGAARHEAVHTLANQPLNMGAQRLLIETLARRREGGEQRHNDALCFKIGSASPATFLVPASPQPNRVCQPPPLPIARRSMNTLQN